MPRPKFVKCCVPGCPSREDQPPHPKFHYVPFSNLKRRRIWLQLIKIKDTPIKKKNIFVCAKHFERVFKTKENKLSRFAYPTLFTREDIEAGKSTKFPISELLGLAAVDHSYCQLPCKSQFSSNIPIHEVLEGILATDKEDAENNSEDKQKEDNNSENKQKVDNNSEDKQNEDNNSEDKQKVDNNSEDKQNEDNNSENKDEVDNLKEKEKEKNQNKKRNVKPQLGSAKRPIYYIQKNNENKAIYENTDIVLLNNNGDNNSTNNDNSVSHANKESNKSSTLHKLLVDNNIINDNGAVDNDNGDHVFDPNMVIDLTENPQNNVEHNVSVDNNPDDNVEPAYDYLAVDHTEVIGDIVENNLTNEQILEKVMAEINVVKSSLSDMALTAKLDTKDMALIKYNNTVVLCHKSEVAELKNKYPELEDQESKTNTIKDQGQSDQDLVVTKAKRRRILGKHGRKNKLKKQDRNEEQNADNEDQEAVKQILCACDANSPCVHKNPASEELIFCYDCKEEHPVNYYFCKQNQKDRKNRPKKASIKKKKNRFKRYVTVEKFEEVNNDVHKLMQTTQQIQGQINTLTTALTSLVNAVGKLEKEREQKLIKKFQQAAKPRPPRKLKPKEPKKTKSEKAVSIMETLLGLPVEESLHEQGEQETLPEEEISPEQETLPARESSHEQETLPEQESFHINEYIPVHRHLPVNSEFLTVNRSLLGKRRLLVQETLPVTEKLSEDEYLPAHKHLPVNNEYLPLSRRLPKKRRLPVQETLPVHGTLSTHNLPTNKSLNIQETSTVDKYLPGNRRQRGGKWLPVQDTLPINDNTPGNRSLRGGKRLPVLYQEETLPDAECLTGKRRSHGGKWLPVRETSPLHDNLPESRSFRGGKRLPVLYQEETLRLGDNLPENRGFRGGLPVQETLPTNEYSTVNRSLPML